MLNKLSRSLSSAALKFSPRQLCQELDKFIIGQPEAKRAVSIALRTRWRRKQLPKEIRDEITPKNILMVGPTGCGKTEIARRLAKLSGAPFLKVEATKFTEVGYHGRDVDQIIKDLVTQGINQTRENVKSRIEEMKTEMNIIVEEYLLEHLLGPNYPHEHLRERKRKQLRDGVMDERMIFIEIPEVEKILMKHSDNATFEDIIQAMREFKPGRTLYPYKERTSIKDAKHLLNQHLTDGLIKEQNVIKEALEAVQENGIVFIDEIDKIATPADAIRTGNNPSAEGVQRDLLPLIEGTLVNTKHGDVKTDHILFIASGAFSDVKPSDLLAELQGRLPIKVVLKSLTVEDFRRILVEPENNIISQHQKLMGTEGVNVAFTEEALDKIAEISFELNMTVENIGARRLLSVLEKVMEDIAFNAPEEIGDVVVTDEMVQVKLEEMLNTVDLKKYLL